jgi:DeoR family transcriptional regulator, fructose operon transcriptional repressor
VIPYERRTRILGLLSEDAVVLLDELAEALGVSASTVRRDVAALVDAGEVDALRGGGVKRAGRASELPSLTKAQLHVEAKRAIAAAAVRLVSDGDTIYLDSGTTTLQMVPLLEGRQVQVVTSNTQALGLAPDGLRVLLLGGDYLASIGSVAGPWTDRMLSDLFFDKAFLGASGCSAQAGISTFDVREAAKKRLAHEHARETFVLVDSSKFGVSTLHRALPLDECVIVADRFDPILEAARSYHLA